VADRTGYLAELVAERSHEADGRIENVAELVGVAGSYEDLSEFLETVALVADSDELDEDGTRVALMTLHIAKGLEFPAVFLIGLEDGIFPHMRALGDPDELEEERRLCYVGITRARRFLAVSHAWTRMLWGSTQHNIPSRFLAELPADSVRDIGPALAPNRRMPGRSPGSIGPQRFNDASSGPNSPGAWKSEQFTEYSVQVRAPRGTTGAEQLGLGAGDAVVHDHWGDGVVLSVSGEGEKAQARVRFATVGEKALLLSATPLRRA
jgi:DNA helicase II / ATP-dependent DNA helicase PcrA